MFKKLTRLTKVKAIIYMVISIALTVCMGLVLVFGLPNWSFLGAFQDSGKAEYISRGLDLKGGVSITYQVVKPGETTEDSSEATEETESADQTESASAADDETTAVVESSADESNTTVASTDSDDEDSDESFAEQLSDTREKLEKRVQQYSTEAHAYIEGDDRITVEIPDRTDVDAILEDLGEPGKIYFCTAISNDTLTDSTHSTVTANDGNEYEIWVDGEEVSDAQGVARSGSDSSSAVSKGTENVVDITFDSQGTTDFANMTTQFVNQTSYIIYNGEILSSPTINEAITGGKAQISGMDSLEEAQNLAAFIRIGGLKLELKQLSHKVVGASLGEDALSKSLKAGLVGIILVMLLLILIYRIPGIAASLALVVYTELVLLVINGYDVTLTLPGIAGVILGIGMAVDANVIIYARIREEIAAGKTVKSAITIGFKKATSAILDGNITTFIAALILIWRGTGSVRGFGQTLAIGIVVSLFTALIVSRFLVWLLYYMGFQSEIFYGKERTRKTINFVSKKFICIGISCLVILIGVATMFINSTPFNFSIEFAGGTTTTVVFDKDYSSSELNDTVLPTVKEAIGIEDVQASPDIDTTAVDFKTPELTEEQKASLRKVLVDEFGASEEGESFNEEYVSGTISNEMRENAVIATIIATICMLIYIWFRFKNIRFAGSAVIALIHDVLVVTCFYAVSRTLVGTNFIACLLTIVGYSINATIVIFDRIRENRATMKRGDSLEEIVNLSITQTLTRSILTSLTTFMMVCALFVGGVSSISDFTLPLMVGIVVGAYSSVFLTGSIWYMFTVRSHKKKNAVADKSTK